MMHIFLSATLILSSFLGKTTCAPLSEETEALFQGISKNEYSECINNIKPILDRGETNRLKCTMNQSFWENMSECKEILSTKIHSGPSGVDYFTRNIYTSVQYGMAYCEVKFELK